MDGDVKIYKFVLKKDKEHSTLTLTDYEIKEEEFEEEFKKYAEYYIADYLNQIENIKELIKQLTEHILPKLKEAFGLEDLTFDETGPKVTLKHKHAEIEITKEIILTIVEGDKEKVTFKCDNFEDDLETEFKDLF